MQPSRSASPRGRGTKIDNRAVKVPEIADLEVLWIGGRAAGVPETDQRAAGVLWIVDRVVEVPCIIVLAAGALWIGDRAAGVPGIGDRSVMIVAQTVEVRVAHAVVDLGPLTIDDDLEAPPVRGVGVPTIDDAKALAVRGVGVPTIEDVEALAVRGVETRRIAVLTLDVGVPAGRRVLTIVADAALRRAAAGAPTVVEDSPTTTTDVGVVIIECQFFE